MRPNVFTAQTGALRYASDFGHALGRRSRRRFPVSRCLLVGKSGIEISVRFNFWIIRFISSQPPPSAFEVSKERGTLSQPSELSSAPTLSAMHPYK